MLLKRLKAKTFLVTLNVLNALQLKASERKITYKISNLAFKLVPGGPIQLLFAPPTKIVESLKDRFKHYWKKGQKVEIEKTKV